MSDETPLAMTGREERKQPVLVTTVSEAAALKAVSVLGVDLLSLLREEFRRLSSKYGLSQYEELKGDLLSFIDDLEKCLAGRAAQLDRLQANLLLAEAYTLLGRTYERLVGQELPAQSAWFKAVSLFEEWLPRAYEQGAPALGEPDFGVALYKVGRKDRAFEVLHKFPRGESGRYLGICLMERGRFAEAEALFQELLRLKADDAFTHKSLAKSLEAQGRGSEAVEEFYLAGYYMLRLNILDEALATLDHARSLEPNSAQVLSLMGSVLHLLGREQEALEALEGSAKLAPDDVFTQSSLAQVLRALGDHERAARVLHRVVTLDPANSWAYIELGTTLYEQGQYEKALATFDKVIELHPNNGIYLYLRGAALEAVGRKTEAIKSFEEAVAAEPKLKEAYRELVALLVEQERSAEALELLRRAEEKTPETAPFLSMLRSNVHLRVGENEAALRAAEESLAGEPNAPLALALKGCALHRLMREKDAVQILQEALALDPQISWAQVELGEAFLYLNRRDEAWQALNTALKLSSDNAAAQELKGRLLRTEYKPEEAAEALRYALELNSGRSGARAELAYLRNEDEATLSAVEQMLKQRPRDAWWLGLKGGALRGLERNEEAIKVLRQSIEENESLPWVYNELGKALSIAGDNQGALEAFEKTLALEPNQVDALAFKGEVLRVMGDSEKALRALDQSLVLRPDNAWALGTKGQILADLQHNEQAISILQQALEIDPHMAWAHAVLGATLYRDGKYPEALAALDRALELEFYPGWAVFTAQLRCDIADYRIAVDLLDRALTLDEGNIEALSLKGWALQNLVPERATELLHTYETAIERDPEDLVLRTGHADALYLNDRNDEAGAEYLDVIKQASAQGKRDRDILSIMGWCYFRLDQYDQAVQCFLDALTINPGVIDDQFNLALAMTCQERYELALREYRRGLSLAENKPLLRRRGLVYVALDDLRVALRAKPELSEVAEVKEILSLLESAYSELDATYKSLVGEAATAAS